MHVVIVAPDSSFPELPLRTVERPPVAALHSRGQTVGVVDSGLLSRGTGSGSG